MRTVVGVDNPDDRLERELIAGGAARVAGVDECGRGAAGGPASVGVTVVDLACLDRGAPAGVRDSKLLSPVRRSALVDPITSWVVAHGVGHVTAEEIDRVGINRALRLAASRAFATVGHVDVVILDGKFDWLAPDELSLFDDRSPETGAEVVAPGASRVMRVGADRTCVSVAAASVLAKVAHDAHMSELEERYPGYGWLDHNGYLTAAHRDAIANLGLSEAHRRSWNIG